MAILRVQAIVPRDSLVPEDESINTWHFTTVATPALPADLDSIAAALTAFYQSIDTDLFPAEAASPMRLRMYQLSDPTPRVPVRESTFPIIPSANTGLPEEVAICLSFQGAAISGSSQARRRGRVFIGPLANNTTVLEIVGGRVRVAAAARTALTQAGNTLKTTSDAQAGWTWVVVSEAQGPGVFIDSPVTNGWCDNAFDTQRRRGPDPSLRTVFP